jgi:hypothetical protein
MLFTTIRKLFSKTIPLDRYPVSEDEEFDFKGALAFTRDQAPPCWRAVMVALQDRIADGVALASNMATAKDPGLLAHANGQLNALVELWDYLEATRAEAAKVQ